MYCQDYDERFPADQWPSNNADPWWILIQPYVKNGGVVDCPSMDGFGSYRSTNDPNYNPNQSEVGNWTPMTPTR